MRLTPQLLDRIVGTHASEAETPVAPLPLNQFEFQAKPDPEAGAEAQAAAAAAVSTLIAPSKRLAPVMPVGARQLDRRRATRLPIGDRARICMDRDKALGLWDTVMLQDISIAGISFVSSQWLSQGDGFEMCLRDRAGAAVQFRCAVRRCERGGFGGVSYLIGASFEALLDDSGDGEGAGGAEDPCGVEAPPEETDQQPTPDGDAAPQQPGALARLFGAVRMPTIARLFIKEDDFSTSHIGRFTGKSKAKPRNNN